ncbi:hypothetical protein JTB14_017607 [Gonioctena quinquepunctata]|nr:hypothetical protein JTB14_017607 [Gonioctena quinquepunctata]
MVDTANVNKSDVLELPLGVTKACGSEVLYFKEIIKQKDVMIKNQNDLVCSVKEQIISLNKVLKPKKHQIYDNGYISPSTYQTLQYLNRNAISGEDLKSVTCQGKVSTDKSKEFLSLHKSKLSTKSNAEFISLKNHEGQTEGATSLGSTRLSIPNAISLAVSVGKYQEIIDSDEEEPQS